MEKRPHASYLRRNTSYLRVFCMCVVPAALSPIVEASVQGFTVQTIAMTGDPAFNRTGDEVYSVFRLPVLSDMGHIAFSAGVSGTGVGLINDTGAWLWTPSQTHWLAREGDAAPGIATTFGDLSERNTALTNGNELLLYNSAAPSIGTLFYGTPGSLLPIAVEGTDPGVGAMFTNVAFPLFTASGHFAFDGSLNTSPATDNIYFKGVGGTYAPLIREGEAILDLGDGLKFGGLAGLAISESDAVLSSGIRGVGINETNDVGIFASTGLGWITVAREGDATPGVAGGTYNQLYQLPSMNSLGQYAYNATINNVLTAWGGIWTGEQGSSSLRVLAGETAPGVGPFITFSLRSFSLGADTRTEPAINRSQTIAFGADLAGLGVTAANNESLWISRISGHQMIAREGDVVEGANGATIDQFINFDLNNHDQVAFVAKLSDGTQALFVYLPEIDGLIKIARESELYEVAEGDFRVISYVQYGLAGSTPGSGGDDGKQSGFNNHEQLAYLLNFTDGSSGVFLATVPEPSTALLIVLSAGALLRRNRR